MELIPPKTESLEQIQPFSRGEDIGYESQQQQQQVQQTQPQSDEQNRHSLQPVEYYLNKEDYEPRWEARFFTSIQETGTIPNISLMSFRFIKVSTESSSGWQKVKEKIQKSTSNKYSNLLNTFLGEKLSERRRDKINEIFDKDDGPRVLDYTVNLGLEFWSQFCNVDKDVLKQTIPSEYWNKDAVEGTASSMLQRKMKKLSRAKRSVLKVVRDSLVTLWQFLIGYYTPARAPERVITAEEKFHVTSLRRILSPGEDIVPEEEVTTFRQKVLWHVRQIYKRIVDAMGGTWPRVRKPSIEEAYADTLIWALTLEEAKKRIQAIMNDRIKKNIK